MQLFYQHNYKPTDMLKTGNDAASPLTNYPRPSHLQIGLFGIGLDTYWPQFSGLKERLEGYVSIVEEKLSQIHPCITNAGLVDTVDKAFETGKLFREKDVDIIFLYVTTYALSST